MEGWALTFISFFFLSPPHPPTLKGGGGGEKEGAKAQALFFRFSGSGDEIKSDLPQVLYSILLCIYGPPYDIFKFCFLFLYRYIYSPSTGTLGQGIFFLFFYYTYSLVPWAKGRRKLGRRRKRSFFFPPTPPLFYGDKMCFLPLVFTYFLLIIKNRPPLLQLPHRPPPQACGRRNIYIFLPFRSV
jgi:hypothetical protein